jgi:exopolysaccharide biosynthesis polyprenyl glycosylphosphotransferase
MNRRTYEIVWPVVLITADFIIIMFSFLISYWLRFYSPFTSLFPVTKGIPSLNLYFYSSIFVGLVFLLSFATAGAYRSHRPRLFSDQLFMVFKAIFWGMVVVLAFSFFYRSTTFSRLTLAVMWGVSLFLVCLERALLSKVEGNLAKRGIGIKRAIVAALPQTARNLIRRLNSKPHLGYQVIGTVVPEESKLEAEASLGNLEDLPQIIANYSVEVVLMSLPLQYHHQMLETALRCDDLRVEFQIAPDMLELLTMQPRIVSLDGTPFISLGKTPLEGWNRILKRTFDMIFTTLGLILLAPFLLLLALLIKIDSSGPTLFKQERIGRDGKRFIMFKFRSMRKDAEEQSGPIRTGPDDQRRTRVGRLLRRYSLDELPQLFNVLKGEMSLVGPRPERPYFVDKLKEDVPRYFIRHKVKSGLTGWAQVNGLRGNTSIEERTKYDLYYVENWSLGLDIKIIFLTLKNILKQENAY